MLNFDDRLLCFLAGGYSIQKCAAWVKSYDGGQDDERVVKILLPLIGCAILTCIVGCYLKKHCAEQKEKKKREALEKAAREKAKGLETSDECAASDEAVSSGASDDKSAPPSYSQRPSLTGSENRKALPPSTFLPGSPGKPTEGRTVSQQSAQSIGASSGYHSKEGILNGNRADHDKPRHSIVSTASNGRDIKPRLLSANSLPASPDKNKRSATHNGVISTKATSNLPNYSSAGIKSKPGSMKQQLETPSARAPDAATLMNAGRASFGMGSNPSDTELGGRASQPGSPRRMFSQPSITTCSKFAPAARSSIQYNSMKPYQRNMAP